ncbi:hypothetical protein HV824_32755 [Myxococcus sp. AM009]|uniref:hypothetical protein n=1 Tax=unclassified Myxococcus TaxID=2648731 RepID=UPI001594EE54|nr:MULTISPECIES: hypothetical protein [unclassified Myxococcus]NVJ02859.1 hypothetical protein [Myxococcus sp. AM009]NVJ17537.1 hypothetical protein [Myxococcus sp. AM010]
MKSREISVCCCRRFDALTHRHRSIRLLSFGRANEPGENEMGQRARVLTQIAGVRGFKVIGHRWEGADGQLVVPVMGFDARKRPANDVMRGVE